MMAAIPVSEWLSIGSAALVALVAIATVPVVISSRRATKRADAAVAALKASQLPTPRALAGAQAGTPRTFQVGAGLTLRVVPLRGGLVQLTATIHGAVGGADVSAAYPMTDELASQIAGALTRSHD